MIENSQYNLELLAANDRFYLALTRADLELMTQIWSQGEDTQCIHPGWDLIRGWDAIRRSWETIFNHQGPVPIAATDPRIYHYPGTHLAAVTCFENIATNEVDLAVVRTICTNLFRRENDNWKLFLHHASLGSPLPGATDAATPPIH